MAFCTGNSNAWQMDCAQFPSQRMGTFLIASSATEASAYNSGGVIKVLILELK